MSTRKCREESKKRQGERENTQIVPTKQAARKGNFTFLKKFQAPIKTIGSNKHQISNKRNFLEKMTSKTKWNSS
jgi:hypothetical protein